MRRVLRSNEFLACFGVDFFDHYGILERFVYDEVCNTKTQSIAK